MKDYNKLLGSNLGQYAKTRKRISMRLHNMLVKDGWTYSEDELLYYKDKTTTYGDEYTDYINHIAFAQMIEDEYNKTTASETLNDFSIQKINNICNKINILPIKTKQQYIDGYDDTVEVVTHCVLDADGWRNHLFPLICEHYPIEGLDGHAQTIVNYILTDVNSGLAKVDLRPKMVADLLRQLGSVINIDLIKIIKDKRDEQHKLEEIASKEMFSEEDSQ